MKYNIYNDILKRERRRLEVVKKKEKVITYIVLIKFGQSGLSMIVEYKNSFYHDFWYLY